MIVLSKAQGPEKIEKVMKVMETVHENDVVSGLVTRKIKGGPPWSTLASNRIPAGIAGRYPPGRTTIGEYHRQRNQVASCSRSTRATAQYSSQPPQSHRGPSGHRRRSELLKQLEVGPASGKGVVKKHCRLSAGVSSDLGGIDGLLHNHRHELGVAIKPSVGDGEIDDQIEVMVLHNRLRKGKDRPSASRQKSASPWEHVPGKYPRSAFDREGHGR